jgi:hypothetical protein
LFWHFFVLVLVLSEAVLVIVIECGPMNRWSFGNDLLLVYIVAQTEVYRE